MPRCWGRWDGAATRRAGGPTRVGKRGHSTSRRPHSSGPATSPDPFPGNARPLDSSELPVEWPHDIRRLAWMGKRGHSSELGSEEGGDGGEDRPEGRGGRVDEGEVVCTGNDLAR